MTDDELFVAVMHRLADVFEDHAILKGRQRMCVRADRYGAAGPSCRAALSRRPGHGL